MFNPPSAPLIPLVRREHMERKDLLLEADMHRACSSTSPAPVAWTRYKDYIYVCYLDDTKNIKVTLPTLTYPIPSRLSSSYVHPAPHFLQYSSSVISGGSEASMEMPEIGLWHRFLYEGDWIGQIGKGKKKGSCRPTCTLGSVDADKTFRNKNDFIIVSHNCGLLAGIWPCTSRVGSHQTP